jgi:hypothetical protein
MIEFFEKPADNSVRPAEFQVFKIFLFLSRLNFVSVEFFWFLLNFIKILKIQRIRHIPNFKKSRILEHCLSPNLDPSSPRSRSKPTIIGLRRRCLGGAVPPLRSPRRLGLELASVPPWRSLRRLGPNPTPLWRSPRRVGWARYLTSSARPSPGRAHSARPGAASCANRGWVSPPPPCAVAERSGGPRVASLVLRHGWTPWCNSCSCADKG